MINTSELVPDNAKQTGEILVSQDLGVSFTEPEHIKLLDATSAVYRSRTHNGERFDVLLHHDPLNGRQLLGFLKEVAPNKIDVSPEGVIGDWDVTDRAKDPGARPEQRLVDLHSFLGQPWLEFIRSQPAFLATMEDARAPRFYSPIFGYDKPQLLREQSLRELSLREIVRIGATSVDKMVEMVERAGEGAEREVVLEALQIEVNKRRQPPQKPIHRKEVIQRRFQSWSSSRKATFIQSILAGLTEEQRQAMLESAVDEFFETMVMPDGHEYGFARSRLQRPLEDSYEDRTKVTDGSYEGEFLKLPGRHGKLEDVLIPGSVRRFTDGPEITPRIAWTRDKNGKREFVFERGVHIGQNLGFSDGVLGVLAVAYFSPELRAEWPERMGIRGSRNQFMGPAQVPVLALMRSKQLLKTDFVEAVESIAA